MSKDIERLRRFVRDMRSAPTEVEELLWGALRNRRLGNLKFRRQVPLEGFIADFVCQDAKLIIEVDGTQHAGSDYDDERNKVLMAAGFHILRFWNDDVLKDLDNICQHILVVDKARLR